ncbi:uncharacterized protein LOC135692126 isoform X2 [Rhopilema esculentum]|eukprot:gene9205-16881_t
MDKTNNKDQPEKKDDEDVCKVETNLDDSKEKEPCSPTKAERQISFCRKLTEEKDGVEGSKTGSHPGQHLVEQETAGQSWMMKNVLKEVEEIGNITGSATDEGEGATGKDLVRQSATEEDDIRKLKTEEDDENSVLVEGTCANPADFRAWKTSEGNDKEEDTQQECRNTLVIWKISGVKEYSKNQEPISKILGSLPTNKIIKEIDEWTLLGRGENVDVYLHDILSSRKHANFRIRRDTRDSKNPRLFAEIQNVSISKIVIVNGNKEIKENQIMELANNDQISIGIFTFLIEIVKGGSKSSQYEIEFKNILQSSAPMYNARQISMEMNPQAYGMPNWHQYPSMSMGAMNRGMPADMPMSRGMQVGMMSGMNRGMPPGMIGGINGGMPPGMIGGIHGGMPPGMIGGINGGMLDGMPVGMFVGTPGVLPNAGMAGSMPHMMGGTAGVGMPGNIAGMHSNYASMSGNVASMPGGMMGVPVCFATMPSGIGGMPTARDGVYPVQQQRFAQENDESLAQNQCYYSLKETSK